MRRFCLLLLILGVLLALPIMASAQSQPDTIILTWSRNPETLFFDFAATTTASYAMKPIYNSLVTTGLDGQIVGELAESWEVSDDQLTWTFKLRQGVKWHDGEPFTAADVKFSYEFPADPNYQGSAFDDSILGAKEKQAGSAAEVEGVKVIDDYTVSITTTEPIALFLYTTAQRYIVPEHVLGSVPVAELGSSSQNMAPIGTGPYRVVSYVRDEAITYERFDDYFGEKAKVKNFIWKIIPEATVQITELLGGTVDIVPEVAADEFADLQTNPDVVTLQLPGVNTPQILMNQNQPYFADKRVRLALYYAINRQALLGAVAAGRGGVYDSLTHPSLPEFNKNLTPYPYDPEKAKALLAEAGWTDANGDGVLESAGVAGLDDGTPFSVELGTLGFPPYGPAAQVIQQNLRDVGIEITINVVDFNVYFSEYLSAQSDYVFGISGWFNFLFPPQGEFEAGYKSDGPNTQFIHWKNDEVDQLLTQARAEFDADKRKVMYDRVQEIIQQEAPVIYLFRPDTLSAYNKNLKIPEVGSLTYLFDTIPQWEWTQ